MKKTFLIIIMLLSFFVINNVYAAQAETTYSEIHLLDDASSGCKAMFGDPKTEGSVAYYLQEILDVMKYLGIILCIVLTILEFFKALMNDDKELFKPLTKKAITRLIYAIFLFFLPILVEVVMTLVGAYGTCGIG